MPDKITSAHLAKAVAMLNREFNAPPEPYTGQPDGTNIPNPGNFHLDSGYGGWKLARMTESGGTVDPINTGFVSARALYDLVHAFAAGARLARKEDEAARSVH
jgi:hypothetical protein